MTWLLLDANNMAYRHFYALGNTLSHKEMPTGMMFGFFREVFALQDRFQTDHVAFCFDHGAPKRKEIFPGYKIKRHDSFMHPGLVQAIKDMRKQLELLKVAQLREIGFRNVWYAEGFEADDVIAKMAGELNDQDEAVIMVSTDKDLYQCLNGACRMWSGKKLVTLQSFYKEYKISPYQWTRVKAIAGCKSDNIPGVPRVGEVTALKYVRKELKESSLYFVRIYQNSERIVHNHKLVDLPLKGTPSFTLEQDEVTDKSWRRFCREFGFESMQNQMRRSKV